MRRQGERQLASLCVSLGSVSLMTENRLGRRTTDPTGQYCCPAGSRPMLLGFSIDMQGRADNEMRGGSRTGLNRVSERRYYVGASLRDANSDHG